MMVMVICMDNIDELLFLGEDISVDGIPICQYDILTLLKMEEDYRHLVYHASMQPIDLFKRSEVNKVEIDKTTMIDLFLMFNGDGYIKKLIDSIIKMLEFVTKLDWVFYSEIGAFLHFNLGEDGKYVGDPLRIDKSNYDDVMKAISKVYHIQKHDPYKKYGNYDEADDETKKVIDELIEEESNEIKEHTITFSSILESVACNSESGLNVLNVKNVTVYQLFRCFYRIEQVYTYKNTMTALYSGCIDGNKINSEDINWARKIQIN